MSNLGKHVLVVEDDEFVLELLSVCLKDKGYNVDTACTGSEMEQKFNVDKTDLVLLDLGLPDADGLDLARKIRSVSNIPIIVLTARKGRDDRLTALGVGADDYLVKPCDPEELVLRVNNVLNRAQQEAAAVPSKPPISAVANQTVTNVAGALAVIAIIGGGIFFSSSSFMSDKSSSPETKTQDSETVPENKPWPESSKCGQVPDVSWWGTTTHASLVSYVKRKHQGDWASYIQKWSKQRGILQSVLDRGSYVKTKDGVELSGDELASHIKRVEKRIDVITCLAKEAAGQKP